MPTSSRTWPCLCLAGLLTIAASSAWSDEPPATAKTPNLKDTLKEVLNRGATLYNSGDRNGAYHLFEGALLTLRPQLVNQTELLQIVENALRDVEQHQDVGQRAWALRTALTEVRDKVSGSDGIASKVDKLSIGGTIDRDAKVQELRAKKERLQSIIEQYKKQANIDSPLVMKQLQGYTDDLAQVEKALKDREDALRAHMREGLSPTEQPSPRGQSEQNNAAKPEQKPAETKPEAPVAAPAPDKMAGKVTLDGKPLVGAFIRLTHIDGVGKGYTAKTDAEGKFEVNKVAPGRYRVAFISGEKGPTIPERYGSKSELTFEVAPGGTSQANFDLKGK